MIFLNYSTYNINSTATVEHHGVLSNNYLNVGASPVAQQVTNPPAMQKTWVQALGWEDPLEKETNPTNIAWKTWAEEPGRL